MLIIYLDKMGKLAAKQFLTKKEQKQYAKLEQWLELHRELEATL